jgi:hypothetical protein
VTWLATLTIRAYTWELQAKFNTDNDSYTCDKSLTRRLKGVGHRLYIDNFFSSSYLSDDLHTRAINIVELIDRTVKECQGTSVMSAYWQMCINQQQKATSVLHVGELINLLLFKASQHMGYVDKGDRMANSYSIRQMTCKWTNKLFFHLLRLTLLSSYIILSSCSSKTDHWKFPLTSVQKMLEINAKGPRPQSSQRGRPNLQDNQMTHLEAWHTKHMPATGLHLWCHVCSVKKKRMTTKFQCLKCKFSLCADMCFHIFHINYLSVTTWEEHLLK